MPKERDERHKLYREITIAFHAHVFQQRYGLLMPDKRISLIGTLFAGIRDVQIRNIILEHWIALEPKYFSPQGFDAGYAVPALFSMLMQASIGSVPVAGVFRDEKIKTHLLDVNRNLAGTDAYFLRVFLNDRDLKVTDRELGQLADRVVGFYRKDHLMERKAEWKENFDWLRGFRSDSPSQNLKHKLVERTLLRQQTWRLLQSLIPLEKNSERQELLAKCCDVIMHTRSQSMYREMFLQASHLLLRQHNLGALSSVREPGDATSLGRAFRKALNSPEYALVKNAHFSKENRKEGKVTSGDLRKFAASSREDRPGFFARKDNKENIDKISNTVEAAHHKTMGHRPQSPKRHSGPRSG